MTVASEVATAGRFTHTKKLIMSGAVNLLSDTLKILLLKPGFVYTSNLQTIANIAGLEVDEDAYYPAGGQAVVTRDVRDYGDGGAEFYIGLVEFPRLNATVSHAILYKEGDAGGITNPMLVWIYLQQENGILFENELFQLDWVNPIFRW